MDTKDKCKACKHVFMKYGLDPKTATRQQVKKQYFKLHPDKKGGNRELFEELFDCDSIITKEDLCRKHGYLDSSRSPAQPPRPSPRKPTPRRQSAKSTSSQKSNSLNKQHEPFVYKQQGHHEYGEHKYDDYSKYGKSNQTFFEWVGSFFTFEPLQIPTGYVKKNIQTFDYENDLKMYQAAYKHYEYLQDLIWMPEDAHNLMRNWSSTKRQIGENFLFIMNKVFDKEK